MSDIAFGELICIALFGIVVIIAFGAFVAGAILAGKFAWWLVTLALVA